MDKGQNELALQVLADLHGDGDINHELVRLEYAEIEESVRELWSHYSALFGAS